MMRRMLEGISHNNNPFHYFIMPLCTHCIHVSVDTRWNLNSTMYIMHMMKLKREIVIMCWEFSLYFEGWLPKQECAVYATTSIMNGIYSQFSCNFHFHVHQQQFWMHTSLIVGVGDGSFKHQSVYALIHVCIQIEWRVICTRIRQVYFEIKRPTEENNYSVEWNNFTLVYVVWVVSIWLGLSRVGLFQQEASTQ